MKRMLRPALCLAALAVGLSGVFCKRSAERNVINGGREQPAPRAITPNDRFLDAVRRGDIRAAQEQLERGADPHATDPLGANAATLAARFSPDPELFEFVRARGARPDAPDRDGRSALSWAAEKNHAEIVRLLLAGGANPNELDQTKRTPLHFAVGAQARECATLLLNAGAAVDAQDQLGDTALMLAAGRGDETLVRLLLARGANRSLKDRDGRTAFERSGGNPSIQRLLR